MTEVVAALIRKEDKFLICQRPAHKKRGLLWEFAGGKVEAGESKKAALIRECREELGVEIRPGDVFLEVEHVYPDLTIRLTVFEAVIAQGVLQRLEHRRLEWIGTEEIDDFEFCPADREILDKLKSEENFTKRD